MGQIKPKHGQKMAQMMGFRLPQEMAQSLDECLARSGESVSGAVRLGLAHWLVNECGIDPIAAQWPEQPYQVIHESGQITIMAQSKSGATAMGAARVAPSRVLECRAPWQGDRQLPY
jgi:hypothetical protein